MLTGSSAYEFEATRQVTTPRIRATLRGNTKISQTTNSDFNVLNLCPDAIDYAGKYVYVGITSIGLLSLERNIVTYDKSTLVADSYTNIGTSNVNTAYGPAKFLDLGTTLALFVTGTRTINVIYSTDGQTWGGTESIATGVTPIDIQPTAADKLYVTYPSGSSPGIGEFTISAYTKVGAAWGVTTLYNKRLFTVNETDGAFFIESNVNGRLLGKRIGNEDYLLVQYREGYGDNDGIKLLRTDGYTVFEERNIIESIRNSGSSVTSQFYLSNIAKGMSYYYLCMADIMTYIDRQNFGFDTIELSPMVMKSTDMVHWGVPIYIRQDSAETFYVMPPSIVAGVTNNSVQEYIIKSINSTLTNNEHLSSMWGLSELDVSNYILDYSNDDNNSISLTLGNYQ